MHEVGQLQAQLRNHIWRRAWGNFNKVVYTQLLDGTGNLEVPNFIRGLKRQLQEQSDEN